MFLKYGTAHIIYLIYVCRQVKRPTAVTCESSETYKLEETRDFGKKRNFDASTKLNYVDIDTPLKTRFQTTHCVTSLQA